MVPVSISKNLAVDRLSMSKFTKVPIKTARSVSQPKFSDENNTTVTGRLAENLAMCSFGKQKQLFCALSAALTGKNSGSAKYRYP
jgi:hypothetical protein